MYRFISPKGPIYSNLQHAINSRLHPGYSETAFPTYFCSYCKNTLNNHTNPEWYIGGVRCQSTRAILTHKLVKKKSKVKYPRKYVELLEVNDKAMMQTKAPVSKLKAVHLSKLALNPEVTLEQLHKLTVKNAINKNVQSADVDLELLRNIERKILNQNNAAIDTTFDDNMNTCQTEQLKNKHKLFQDRDKLMSIKDSYDKFRRETFRTMSKVDIIPSVKFDDIESPGTDSIERIELDNNSEIDQFTRHSQISNSSIPGDLELENLSKFDELEETDLEIDEIIPVPAIVDKTKKNNQVTFKINSKKKKIVDNAKEQEKLHSLGKQIAFSKLLLAHMDVCISVGSLNEAYKILMHYRSRGKKLSSHSKLSDINLYNTLLNAYAKTGNYKAVKDLLNVLKEDEISLNLQSYAAIFECIERSDMSNKKSKLNEYYNTMKAANITFDNIMNGCKFLYDQRETVARAMRNLDSNYIPTYIKPNMDYSCALLTSLNPSEPLKIGIYNKSGKISSPAEGLIDKELLAQKILQQIQNEIKGTIAVKNIEVNEKPPPSVLHYREKLNSIESEWRIVIKRGFLKYLSALKAQSHASYHALNIYPYLISLDVDEYVELLMLELRKIGEGSETYSPSVKEIQKDLGVRAYYHYQVKKIKTNGTMEKIVDLYKEYCDWYLKYNVDLRSEDLNPRRKWQQLIYENQNGVSLNQDDVVWPNGVCVAIGKFLYNILITDVKINANIFKKDHKKPKYLPVLYNVFRGKGKLVRQEVKPHPLLPRLIRESKPTMLNMETILVPSFCPPLPWSDYLHGGYLLTKTSVMRIASNGILQMERLKESPPENLYPALDNLNQLGAMPWVVNKPILDVLLHVFKSGGSHELNVARPASSIQPPLLPSGNLSKKERVAILRQRSTVSRLRQEMHSLWCDSLYKLSLANHYRDEIFWLPHNMDFRGRVYPCPPHLSHLGADTSRALLVFAQGKPLGPNGLKWLKLHCINLTGTMKKNTIQERLDYVESIMDQILDSADKPLDGHRWWAKSEDPWQTLASCKEIANALRSPNPEEYICHFPIHQDGSCNGLQHYAALGGDSAGAFSVNLAPADRPQDVYSAIVNLVEASRAKDAANNIQIAKVLEGFLSRKVIKQTVMTTVYGVTKFGARLQIAKQLKDIDDFPKDYLWQASSYLAGKTFESLQEMFTSTKEIQDWFTECAKMISGVYGAKIEWVTPLGLPVVQPYYKRSKMYSTGQNIYECSSYDQYEKPCILKQKNAFPPNFIHSLDSSHMMLTSLHCEMSDITFMSVHDCFWTHPSTVEIMNKICREQFISLHSKPILETLSSDLIKKYSFNNSELDDSGSARDVSKKKLNILLKRLPQKGNFDLKNVLNSVYFFS